MTAQPAPSRRGARAGLRAIREDPLVAALRLEIEQLRTENRELAEEVLAAHAAQADLVRHLRVTAPLRRVQEVLRHRSSERRRRAGVASHPRTGSLTRAQQARDLATIPEDQAHRHPLLGRTRDWLAGGRSLAAPDMEPLRQGRAGRVLVVAHVFYPELWPELAEHIRRIPVPSDLVVTLVEGFSESLADSLVAEFPEVRIEVLHNRGRDMWPFVRILELGLVGDYDAVLKLHTKASVHRIGGARWRGRLLDSLCPSPEGIDLILELLRRDPDVGMVTAAGAALGSEFWGSNGLLIEALGARTGISVDPDRVWFPGGSMFWSRPKPLNRLRKASLTVDDFEREAVTIDGTTAHALERFVGALVAAEGLAVVSADEVPSRVARARALNLQGA